MKIRKDSIITLAKEGHVSIQIPFIARCVDIPSSEVEEIPDDWICELKDNRIATGKESGFLFLTRKGWEANKEKLEAAFLSHPQPRGTWSEFETYAANLLDNVERTTKKYKQNLEAKLKELQDKGW